MSMDNIFCCDEQQFCSDVINPKEFLEKAIMARNKVEEITQLKRDESLTTVKQFAQIIGISDEASHNIFEHCDLKDPDVNFNFEIDPGMDDSVVPRTTSKMFEHLQNERERRLNPQNKSIAFRGLRYDKIDPYHVSSRGFNNKTSVIEKWANIIKGKVRIERPRYTDEGNDNDLVIDPQEVPSEKFLYPPAETLRSQILPWGQDDVLINVSIYLGYSRALQYHEIRLGRLMKVTDRLVLRGEQTLFDLKKGFHCLQDYVCLEDVSHRNPTLDDLTLNCFPSSYFFIHDTFYLDQSKSGASDTSESVRKWASGRSNIGSMYLGKMDTKLIDLKFRLGQPYLYQHQGICEHTIVFTDFHLRDYNDQCGPYPLRLLERKFRRITCIGCRSEGADWAVMNCDVLPTTPAYLCRSCYLELLFHEDGTKRYHFEAVPYFDRKAMDDCGVFLEELKKNISLVKNEELSDDAAYGIQPNHPLRYEVNHLDDEDDDMSSYDGNSSVRSLHSSERY